MTPLDKQPDEILFQLITDQSPADLAFDAAQRALLEARRARDASDATFARDILKRRLLRHVRTRIARSGAWAGFTIGAYVEFVTTPALRIGVTVKTPGVVLTLWFGPWTGAPDLKAIAACVARGLTSLTLLHASI